MTEQHWIYIISNPNHTVFYTGMTFNLAKRIGEHKQKAIPSFTTRYNCTKLLYYEGPLEFESAQHREQQIKRYRRAWKENLISELNPSWEDLSDKF